jgi:hypothetical protein
MISYRYFSEGRRSPINNKHLKRQLISWSTVLQNLLVVQMAKKFLDLYGIGRFIAMFTKPLHRPLS